MNTAEKEKSSKEASWTLQIPSESVCQYFYIMFFILAALSGVVFIGDVLAFTRNPKLGLILLLRSVFPVAIAVLNALFLYIICVRSLLK
jgi:hypothetical protein